MYKVGINFDEISDDLDEALKIMREENITYGELRTIKRKNFVFWNGNEIANFKKIINEAGIELVAAATPLFKWYLSEDAPEVEHDSFGFNPRLSDEEKRQVIKRTFEIAHELDIPKLRIFSGIGQRNKAVDLFLSDPLLSLLLEQATKYAIDVCLENEPVCYLHTKSHIIELFNKIKHPRLKLWLDIANLEQINERVDTPFLEQIITKLAYIHVKDFVKGKGGIEYTEVGNGMIPYQDILTLIDKLSMKPLIYTVETHAKANKIEASVTSLRNLELLLASKGV